VPKSSPIGFLNSVAGSFGWLKSVSFRANWIGLNAASGCGVTTPLNSTSSAGGMKGVGETEGVSVIVGVRVMVDVRVMVGVRVTVGV